MRKLVIFILSFIVLTNCSSDKEKTCRLIGKVIDRDSKILIIKKQTDDSRGSKSIKIPIDSLGNFKYDFKYQFVEAYELIFEDELNKGVWRPILFFPDNNKIEFTLYPIEKFDSNKIVGSKLIEETEAYKSLIQNKFINQFNSLRGKTDSLKQINQGDSKYATELSDSIKHLLKSFQKHKLTYIKNHLTLYGYTLFLKILINEKWKATDGRKRLFSTDSLTVCANLLKENFPNHPYNEIAQFRLNGLINMKIGGQYVNFTANDSVNNQFILSDIIKKNKITLIDLWAPWCGPCIKKSRKAVPIYNEFKDKGFAVIGVVGGINSKEQYRQALKRHPYPWVVLAEINNEHNIWEKYGIARSGGSQFLVDSQGKILAINPSQNEIKKHILNQ